MKLVLTFLNKFLSHPVWAGIGVIIPLIIYFLSSSNSTTYTNNEVINMGNIAYLNKPLKKKYTWSEAKKYCQKMPDYGFLQWRLPTKTELDFILRNKSFQKNKELELWTSSFIKDSNNGSVWVVKVDNMEWYQNSISTWNHHVLCITTKH